MNASPPSDLLYRLYVSMGSNIRPEENIPRAVNMLRAYAQVESISRCYETRAVGSSGPNFINLAICLVTPLDTAAFKRHVITPIENTLGRVRQADKNAPRTIDLDVILANDQIIDAHLWDRVYLATPFAELYPAFLHPQDGRSLQSIAAELQKQETITIRDDIL